MPDLIVHIGFPKCASSTLQNQVFKKHKGYLGTHENLSMDKNMALQFKGVTPVGPRQWSNFCQAKKWADRVHKEYSNELSSLILSEEMLSNKNKFNALPIIPFLEKFSKEIWTSGDLKVIVVLRNTAEMMASSYSQNSAANPYASQLNFERFIDSQLTKRVFRDYSVWISKLYAAFGKQKVCVLLMEDIDSNVFWQQLHAFCNLPEFQNETKLMPKLNSKRKTKNSWEIAAFSPEKKARVMAINLFGFIWPYFILSKYRNTAILFTKKKLSNHFTKKYLKENETREDSITLTEKHREEIESNLRSSTKILSELLGRDMNALGY